MSDYSDFSQSSSIDPIYLQPLTTVFYVTSSVSLVSNLTVCVFHGAMASYQVAELNRVSLRLIVMACLAGFVFSVFRFAMVIPADTIVCSVDTFFITCTDLASPFCLSMVGVHAVCVLVLNVNDPRKLEKYYYLLIFCYSVVVAIVAVAASPSNYPETYSCWVRFYFGKKNLQRFNWIWYLTLLLLPIALSACCSLILLVRYKMERHNFAATSVRYAQNNNPFLLPMISSRYSSTDPIKTFRQVIIRSTFYTLIPLVSKILTFTTGFSNLTGEFNGYHTLVAAGVITTLQGFFVSILYFSDPAVIYTIRRFFNFLRRVYVDDYKLPPLKPVESIPPPPPIDNMWMSRYDEDDTWMGDEARGAAIRLSRVNHDMIAEDNMEDQTNRSQHQRRQSTYLCPVILVQYPWDPYHCRRFAKMMHWFLTKVCRLKPRSFIESTSTLSYHSQPLTASPVTQFSTSMTMTGSNEKQSSDVSLSTDNGKTSSGAKSVDQVETKKRIPTVQFDSPLSEKTRAWKKPSPTTSSPIYATFDDTNQYLSPWSTEAVQRHQSFSTSDSLLPSGSTPTSFSPPMRWDSPSLDQVKSSDGPTSSCRIARGSKKLRHVMLHRHYDSGQVDQPRRGSKATILSTSLTSSPSRTTASNSPSIKSSASLHLPGTTGEEDVDRLSLLSSAHSAGSSSNKGYQPLSAPPRHYHQEPAIQRQRDEHLPTLSITLPDADTPEKEEEPITIPSPLTPARSAQPHGVPLDPSTVTSLLDWEPSNNFHPARSDYLLMEPDGIEHGWTSLIHIQQSWDQVNSKSDRMILFVEHWVKNYLGSRWFVVE